MMNVDEEIKRLTFEDYIWIVVAILAFFNIFGDNLQKKYLKTNNINYDKQADKVFLFALGVSFFIYLYFLYRNYNIYKKSSEEEKSKLLVKLIGSSFILAGVICLIYFQLVDSDFIGSPAI